MPHLFIFERTADQKVPDAHAPPEVRRVCAADKLHNARTVLAGYRASGDQKFDRFRGGQLGTVWYYRAITDALRARNPPPPLPCSKSWTAASPSSNT